MKQPARTGRARDHFVTVSKVALSVALTFAGYVGAISPVLGPGYGDAKALAATGQPVSLSKQGDQLALNGPAFNLFQSPVFSGPNSIEKRDRFSSTPDINAFAQTFSKARTQLAALREPVKVEEDYRLKLSLETRLEPRPAALALTKEGAATAKAVADAATSATKANADKAAQEQIIKIATVDPIPASAALDAINSATQSDAPTPLSVPKQLAYARETTPTTEFSSPDRMSVSQKQYTCLAEAVYFEARGEGERGQAAVAQVILNRVKSSVYPDSICGVVYQNQARRNACQFSFACDGKPERITEPNAWSRAKSVAKEVVEGQVYLPEVANATHYHATYVSPRWAKNMKRLTKIGLHVFYRFRQG